MSDRTKTDPPPQSQRPRSTRVPVNFTVELEGTDGSGRPFHVTAEAVRVSRGGATIVTDVYLKAGASLLLTPPFGRTLAAEVNGVWTEGPESRQHIGVRLIDPNGWFAE